MNEIRREVEIRAPLDAVFDALTGPPVREPAGRSSDRAIYLTSSIFLLAVCSPAVIR